jgi:hypothetical protein
MTNQQPNFGDGTINAFDATGQLRGRLVTPASSPWSFRACGPLIDLGR